jgi:hypothetical protein
METEGSLPYSQPLPKDPVPSQLNPIPYIYILFP